jgi:cytochrome c oxidase subunit I
MALTEERPLELTTGADGTIVREPLGVFRRPSSSHGWRSWVTTVDHKKIGIMYGFTSLMFFFVGGMEALLIRTQLARPDGTIITGDTYNQVFTTHGITMIFFVVMPLSAAFANYLIPLQIGARDVAFPRLNALSYWIFLFGGLFFYSSFFLGGLPNCGWFCYQPNAGGAFSPGHGVDFFALGLQIAGIASLIGAINLIVTALNMRAPGMSLMKMPIFTWMALVTQFLLLFAIPVITVALFLVTFDRIYDANFFNVKAGADPLLWQHLFWIFGHPEVYIMILPAFGIVSEILPVFSRKPLFGYPFMVFSGIAIGFMGWGVWAHHMFASGIGPVSVAAFSLTTMFIAVPTGVKIFNWLGTMWGGKLTFDTPMLFGIGLVTMFTIGGLSGVSHAVSPSDWQQTDTYYIVAHFHYVLFGGALFGLVGGMYFWWPKIFGHRLREGLGKLHFWIMLIGFNLTFGPMHILGLQGMPRRYYRYPEGNGWDFWNLVATIGSYLIFVAFVVFAVNILLSRRDAKRATEPMHDDPWDARSLEWMTSSPPPHYNFDEIPTVSHLDEFWYRKYDEDQSGRLVRLAESDDVVEHHEATSDTPEGEHAHGIHLPSPSYWPIVLAAGLPLIAYGILYTYWLSGLGALLVVVAIYGWGLEPSVEPEPVLIDTGAGSAVETGTDADTDTDTDGDAVPAGATSSEGDGQ